MKAVMQTEEARYWLEWMEKDPNRELWRGQVMAALRGVIELNANVRDPNCEACHGTGEYFWHSANCESDFCVLAGGVDDCDGEVIQCNCKAPTATEPVVAPDPLQSAHSSLPCAGG